ncbi:unnamed protein product [Closterium sp. NIES-53]
MSASMPASPSAACCPDIDDRLVVLIRLRSVGVLRRLPTSAATFARLPTLPLLASLLCRDSTVRLRKDIRGLSASSRAPSPHRVPHPVIVRPLLTSSRASCPTLSLALLVISARACCPSTERTPCPPSSCMRALPTAVAFASAQPQLLVAALPYLLAGALLHPLAGALSSPRGAPPSPSFSPPPPSPPSPSVSSPSSSSLLSSLHFVPLIPSSTSFPSASAAAGCWLPVANWWQCSFLPPPPPPYSSSSYLPLHSTHPFTLLLLSSLPSSPPHLTLSSTSILSSPAAAGCSPYFVAVLLPHSIPLPLDSPLSISAADYSTHIPPPLVYPLSCSAADYSAHIPLPLVLPSTAQHQTTPAIFLRLLFLPSAAQQQTTPAIFLRLLFLPSAAQQQTTPAIFLRLLFLPSAAQEQTTPPLSLLLFCFPSSGPLPPPTPPPTPAPLMAPVLALPSLPLRYCLPPPITPPPLPSLPSVASVVPFPPCNTTTYCWTSLLPPRPAWLPLSHPRHTSASAMPAISTSDTGTLASIFSVTTPSQDSILGASPLMDPHFAVPFAFPVYDTVSHSPSHTAVVVSPPHTLDFVLNSGASDSIFRDASVLRSFPRPLSIQGAGDNMTMICTAASSLPCPASPSGAVTGL